MKSIIDLLSEQQTWEEFLTYRLLKGRLTWYEFDEADTFVSEEQYLDVVRRLQGGGRLSVPTRHLVNKMGSGKKRVVYSFPPQEMIVMKAMAYLLYRYDSQLASNCYSFRRGLTAHDAVRDIVRAIGDRPMWGYKLDIHDYFNSISIPLLLPVLSEVLADDPPLYYDEGSGCLVLEVSLDLSLVDAEAVSVIGTAASLDAETDLTPPSLADAYPGGDGTYRMIFTVPLDSLEPGTYSIDVLLQSNSPMCSPWRNEIYVNCYLE